ncbi:DUF5807 family protein [Halocalculus aciditolerans]|uniref:Uncharacterized protein n=1 Tax=Halocalculus aciditolerans TaxID=1383812 RepID=A0A830FM83_9EURY|nr:DUF5807 family protein [Halocalculus aciditolerans]GGL69670.1 hypothetical protein GCM10009039_29570 [Halocalculus aciditolerans]
MTNALDEFLDGDRVEDVAVYLSESTVGDLGALAEYGVDVDDGIVLVLPGDQGRSAFKRVSGMDAMDFAGRAMDTDGDIDRDLASGECPSKHADEPDDDHRVKLGFAFAEEQNEEVGGLYAEGAVVHAYAYCTCGTAYSDRWLIDE